MADAVEKHVCDSCGAEWWGATLAETKQAGWRRYDAKHGRLFVMCGDCVAQYQARRDLAKAA